MTRLLSCAAAAVAALCFALPASVGADIPNPDGSQKVRPPRTTPKENTMKLVIEAGDNPEAQIWLPPELRVQDVAAGATETGLTPLQTEATGLALSLSIVFGGLWLVRARKRLGTRATATAVAIFGVLAGTAVYTLANAGPPRNYQPADPGTLRLATPAGDPLSGTARYYYGYDQGVVRIVLPKKQK
jgi:hypothetical protein